jgi:hypothetical protein
VILDKIERGQKLTEGEEIIWKQYKKTGNNAR